MIDYINKDYFLQDGIDKQIIITYGEKNVTNESIYSEEFALTQSICSESALKFGGCESGMLEFKVKGNIMPLYHSATSVFKMLYILSYAIIFL